jgi:hypothetical protein
LTRADEELLPKYDLLQHLAEFKVKSGNGKTMLVSRIQQMMGFQFAQPISRICSLEAVEPLAETDFGDIGDRVKVR